MDEKVRKARHAAAQRLRRQQASPDTRAREAAAKRQKRQADAELRAREAAAKRQRRQQATPETRAQEAAAKRQRRQQAATPETRAREAAAKRQRRQQVATPGTGGADARFKHDSLDRSFGQSCKVCDRFDNALTNTGNIRNEHLRAIAVLQQEFSGGGDHSECVVCSTCKDSLVGGKVPAMSVTHGYRYPPKPEHLPALNRVEERLIAPRLPFMSIRCLAHGNGQYGIKGQVVNVPMQETVQCLPRNIPDDAAIDVHIKRQLMSKPSSGLVKKRNLHAWLKYLEDSPLYKYLNIKVGWSLLAQFDNDVPCDDDDEKISIISTTRASPQSTSFTKWRCGHFFIVVIKVLHRSKG
ncbi:uncharacterized protein LOC121047852 isoform X2 [Ixodes scapularis]|uniref:uncharacterized protein LOC121047852 isoform X2 n=1 Tax=Ixodes scapularis TaxID=6945 RepID=UPI001C38A77B|nr:uncharacterized protein LOC121047852 isoform X2 [Ixodes scapularis]